MRRLMLAMALAAVPFGGTAAHGATLCVGSGAGCYAALQPAFDAAHDGDRIRIDPGTYAGGVTLTKSVTVQGSGANRTIIKGGGPVLMIGTPGAPDADKLTVSISGVTVTGGLNTGLPGLPFVARGGGIDIPGGANGTVGATVTIRNSAVTGNRTSPGSTVDSGDPCPGGGDCPFALAIGAGIVDVGRLTLVNSLVSDNVAGGPNASEAAGAGIWTATNGGAGALTLIGSAIVRNTAAVGAPNGRFAQGGGVNVQDGEALVVRNTAITDNTASVSGTFDQSVNMFVNSGGLHIGGFGSAVVENTLFARNVASYDDPNGSGAAADAALTSGFSDFCACGQTLDLSASEIRDNRTVARAASSSNGQSGGIVEFDSQAIVTDTVIEHNTTIVRNGSDAGALGTLFAFDLDSGSVVVRNSAVRNNTVEAHAGTGAVSVLGGGVLNGAALELHSVDVSGNAVRAFGDTGVAQGGGIWNGHPFSPDDPPPQLTLDNTRVRSNMLFGLPGVTRQGGGLYTPGFQVSAINTLINGNRPDQCFGC